jgi:hypothetical protein
MKEFTIRKKPVCGHWLIFKKHEYNDGCIVFLEVAHCETFSDILVLINLYELVEE